MHLIKLKAIKADFIASKLILNNKDTNKNSTN